MTDAHVTYPDLRAADWIAENTSPDSRLLVNFSYGLGDAYILGTDGGWWLPLPAARDNTAPTLAAGG